MGCNNKNPVIIFLVRKRPTNKEYLNYILSTKYIYLISETLILTDIITICCCCCCWVTSVMSNCVRPHRWQPTRLPRPPGILQARTLEWAAISFSNAWKWKVKVKSLNHVCRLSTSWTAAYQAPPSMGFSRQEYWNGVPLPFPCIHTSKMFIGVNWLVLNSKS